MKANLQKKIFGDFQTPLALAKKMCRILQQLHVVPKYIIEPNCGQGNIFFEAIASFPETLRAFGIELKSKYIDNIKNSNEYTVNQDRISLYNEDYFRFEIRDLLPEKDILSELDLLIIGNPPWITNSELGYLNKKNNPEKSNFKNVKGIDAITGKSNFDVSEYILLDFLKKYKNIKYTLGMLCKTSVARRVLRYAWENEFPIKNEKIFKVDAVKYFNASVDACFFVIQNDRYIYEKHCDIYTEMDLNSYERTIGFSNKHLISDIKLYQLSSEIEGESPYVWRNGLKHDASKVMEFTRQGVSLLNGYNEELDIENDLMYPLLKSSDIANGNVDIPKRFVLITQRYVGEETSYIKYKYPKTWEYLNKHQEILDNRKSSIYKDKPRFSVFSVGGYTFSKYKVAISSLYKNINFRLISNFHGKPYILDDTCNFIPLMSKAEAGMVFWLLSSDIVASLIESLVFWDSKRVITTELLNMIDLALVAKKFNVQDNFLNLIQKNSFCKKNKLLQLSLF